MDLEAEKRELIDLILKIRNPETLARVKSLIEEGLQEEVLSPSLKKEIQIGLEQLDRGERISLENFLERQGISPD